MVIHSTAVVDADAELAEGVTVGPWSVIGAGVVIGEDCNIASHVSIAGPTRMGRNNRIYPFTSIGTDPQDKKYSGGAKSELIIGDGNTIRELVTINRGTPHGGGRTVLGDDNWLMAYVHVAHDCTIGNHTVLANNVALAGHVRLSDYVVLSGRAGVHQFCRVGCYSFAASCTVITQDVPPFILVSGNRAKPYGLNSVGLRRHGFSGEQQDEIKRAYRCLYHEGRRLDEALELLADMAQRSEPVALFLEFLREPGGGIVR